MGGRNENSPDCLKRKRPLSIIQEHLDEDVGAGEGSGAGSGFARTEHEPNSRTTDKNTEPSRTSGSSKKTRRIAIIHQHHPDLSLPSHKGSVEPLGHSCSPQWELEKKNDQTVSGTEGDLTRLKDTAIKLNLKTRRQSYLTWRAKYVDKPREPPEVAAASGSDEKLTHERKARMDNALAWIREELVSTKMILFEIFVT